MTHDSHHTTDALILVVDDEEGIHKDYQKILASSPTLHSSGVQDLELELFGEEASEPELPPFCLVHAFQGQEAVALTRARLQQAQRISMAFVDVRMPPGWNGVETVRHLWSIDPSISVILSTAYSDFSWEETITFLGRSDGLQLLRKPFAPSQVRDIAISLTGR